MIARDTDMHVDPVLRMLETIEQERGQSPVETDARAQWTADELTTAGIPDALHGIAPMFTSLTHFRAAFGLPDPSGDQ